MTLNPFTFLRRSVLGRAATYAWRWLGSVRKRLFYSPLIAGALTVSETAVLLLAARLLLSFVEEDERLEIGVFGIEDISFFAGCGLGVGMALFTVVLRFIDSRFTASLAEVAVRTARNSLLESSFHTRWQDKRSHRLGELQRLLATNGSAAAVPVVVIATVLNAGSALIVYLAIITATAPQLLVMIVVLVAGMVGAFAPLRRMMKRRAREHTAAIASLQLDATSFSGMQREFELYAVQDESLELLKESNRSLAAVFRQQKFLQRFVSPVYQLTLMTSIILAVAFARFLDLTVAGVGTAALLLLRSLSYVQQLNGNVQTAIEAMPLLAEIDGYVADAKASTRQYGTNTIDRVATVELHDVAYAYDVDPVLEHVNLKLESGDRVGIVGTSGGGKSTLANMLVRLTDATQGQILVNGSAIDSYSTVSWAGAVAFVGQEPLLLRGTIAENVRLFREATDEQVTTALRTANLLHEIDQFPEGLNTQIGEGNNAMSGGQRQRLGIARALLTNPSLIVLDEPSSALDASSEQHINQALVNLDPSTIVIIISHRPLLLEACTKVIQVADGRAVVEERHVTTTGLEA